MVSCEGEFSSSYDEKQIPLSTAEDVKPNYLVGYGSVSSSSQDSENKADYDPYYAKLQSMKTDGGAMKVPKTEITTTSCCSVPGKNVEYKERGIPK